MRDPLALAKMGLRLFPITPNKKKPPAFEDWQTFATSDPGTIEKWFGQGGRFETHNIGIATGQGLVVLDADAKDGKPGLKSLELLDMEGLPESFRVKTPSGGVHVYLTVDASTPIACSVNSIEGYPGIDVRGEGGYVVGPGSVTEEGTYEIL